MRIISLLILFSFQIYSSQGPNKALSKIGCESKFIDLTTPDHPPKQILRAVKEKIEKQSSSHLSEEIFLHVLDISKAHESIESAIAQAALEFKKNPYTIYQELVYHTGLVGAELFKFARKYGRELLENIAEFDHNLKGTHPDLASARFIHLRNLFDEGKFAGSFGNIKLPGMVKVYSRIKATRQGVQNHITNRLPIGRNLILPSGEELQIAKAEVSPMLGISAMSFPQISGRSVLSLLTQAIVLTREGTPILMNTGEGGPRFHLALLDGDLDKLISTTLSWGRENNFLTPGGNREAGIIVYLKKLMQKRDQLFKKFNITKEDRDRVQIIAQFGTAMNGIKDQSYRVDFDLLREVSQHPSVKMIEFKLKQAAKRGSKNDKISPLSAALRLMNDLDGAKSPAINPDMVSFQDDAIMILATKLISRKPVSLKFAIGNVGDTYDYLKYLRDMSALPDNIQLDGSDLVYSPGSGNAPPTETLGDTNLNLDYALPALNFILSQLGVRDQIRVAASGSNFMPTQSLKNLALGADYNMGARTWMAMGLGCRQAKKCRNGGQCPYAIASDGMSSKALSMDPEKVVEKGLNAARSWYKALIYNLNETGSFDWRLFRKTHGLHSPEQTISVLDYQNHEVVLRDYIDTKILSSYFSHYFSQSDVINILWHSRPEELRDYLYMDASRKLTKFLQDRQIVGENLRRKQELWIKKRRYELMKLIYEGDLPSAKEIFEFTEQSPPADLFIGLDSSK